MHCLYSLLSVVVDIPQIFPHFTVCFSYYALLVEGDGMVAYLCLLSMLYDLTLQTNVKFLGFGSQSVLIAILLCQRFSLEDYTIRVEYTLLSIFIRSNTVSSNAHHSLL